MEALLMNREEFKAYISKLMEKEGITQDTEIIFIDDIEGKTIEQYWEEAENA